jgi:hypothetical protein
MQNVRYLPLKRKNQVIVHYAYLGEVYGTAELLNGTGYVFRAEGERKATLVSYRDSNLVLLGRCDLADLQQAADDARGGAVSIACRRQMEV